MPLETLVFRGFYFGESIEMYITVWLQYTKYNKYLEFI